MANIIHIVRLTDSLPLPVPLSEPSLRGRQAYGGHLHGGSDTHISGSYTHISGSYTGSHHPGNEENFEAILDELTRIREYLEMILDID